MFDHYKTLVLQNYREKIAAGTLSPNLVNPTPAKVKSECIQICEERFLKSDEGVLRVIFRQQDGPMAYRLAIKQRDTDTFKPLCNFLKGGTNNPEEKNVELLAWLIDFKVRPYAIWRNSGESTSVNEIAHRSDEKEDGKEPSSEIPVEILEEGQLKPGRRRAPDKLMDLKRRNISLLTGLLLLTCVGGYLIDSHVTGNGVISKRGEECMYWDKDRYQPVRCSEKIAGVPVYALDTDKATHLRKINRPDTLTKMSVGSVWYSKIDNKVEFFTCDGYHPIFTTRRLKPVTELIIGKYARQQVIFR